MAGPIVTSPPLTLKKGQLDNPRPGGATLAAINKTVEAQLAEQALRLDSLVKPELAGLQAASERLLPHLITVAGVDPKAFDEATQTFQASLAKIAGLPAKERSAALAAVAKEMPDALRKVAATVEKVSFPTPGTSVALMGAECLLGGVDAGAFAAVEWWLRQHGHVRDCVGQHLVAPYGINVSFGFDPHRGDDTFEIDRGRFRMTVNQFVAGWQHKSATIGPVFHVRPEDRHVSVTAVVTANHPEFFTQSGFVVGFPYSHAWTQIGLTVSDGTRQVAASPVVEPFNIVTHAALVEVDLGDEWSVMFNCSFDRIPGSSPLGYFATIRAQADITLALGTSQAVNGLALDHVDVLTCT